VPAALIEGFWLKPVEGVSWVRLPVVVSTRKISKLPSGLPPVRSAEDLKAIRVPAALIAGESLSPVVAWVS
jgi:hypothetical protein